MIQVKCALTDCIHWNADASAGPAPNCKCAHPDKRHYLNVPRCPLYRLDWSKQAAATSRIPNLRTLASANKSQVPPPKPSTK